ncbi:hypothetical protein ZWY2020_024659 [Hordeum vulgare]|nr:hypothetical protein ZWY2020_024659 [Hordeum vulgare]
MERSKHGKRNGRQDGNTGRGRGKGRPSGSSREMHPGGMKNNNALQPPNASTSVMNVIRRKVEPETAKYFLEISNLFDNKEIDLEDRSTICANALEETKGKELELVTDGVISHTLQILVQGCELEQLCMFLRSCIQSFHVIAMDKFGSHVAEAALKTLATHLEDDTSRVIVEEILNKICKVIAADATNVMCSCYGSHVLRTLLCLCKGVPLDSLQDFHMTKRSAVLAERLSGGSSRPGDQNLTSFEHGFPDMFRTFVRQMLQNAKNDISTLLTEKNSSLVLQTVLKLSAGDDDELNHIISILLGYDEDDTAQKKDYSEQKNKIVALLEDTAYSHLLEVIIDVAPEELRSNMLIGTLKGALFAISSHHCGNYVVQALISSAKTADQMKQIWEELGPNIKELLELGKSGVVASILAACQRLETNRLEISEALSAAITSDSESSDSIVAHILFLENFLREKSYWKWPLGVKMSVLGCLMLQSIFQYPHIARPLWEIAMNPSGSFLVEKCFTASNFSHKEAIVSELLAMQNELSRTRHAIHLLKKLDVDRYSRRPDQWRAAQTSKETTQREFQAEFGLNNSKPIGQSIEELLSPQSPAKKRKQKEKTDKTTTADASTTKPESFQKSTKAKPAKAIGKRKSPGFLSDKPIHKKQKHERPSEGRRFVGDGSSVGTPFVRNNVKQKQSIAELAAMAGKDKLTAGEVRKLLKPEISAKGA